MDPVTIGIIIAILAVVLATLLFLKSRNGDKASSTGAVRRPQPVDARQAPQGARGQRRAGPRMRRSNAAASSSPADADDSDDEDGGGGGINEDQREELEQAGIKVPEGKIGKKKLEKLQMKADKKLAREAEERIREEEKKKKAEKEAAEAKVKEKEEKEEKERMEKEKKEREEKERKEYEEYLKMKAAFEVEEEGYDENEDGDGEENKLKKFIDYIKETKVVLLEDLASHFKMKTQETIDRINQLQEDNLLTGVIDDRGKFIYISQEELDSVAKFIRQRGRVSIAELAECSNKLINLNPESTPA